MCNWFPVDEFGEINQSIQKGNEQQVNREGFRLKKGRNFCIFSFDFLIK